jgi:ornithine decarboxylase
LRAKIALVQSLDTALTSAGVTPTGIVCANLTKAQGHVDRVPRRENDAEVRKYATVSKKIQLLLRIITDNSGSQCWLSSKFVTPQSHWPALLGWLSGRIAHHVESHQGKIV